MTYRYTMQSYTLHTSCSDNVVCVCVYIHTCCLISNVCGLPLSSYTRRSVALQYIYENLQISVRACLLEFSAELRARCPSFDVGLDTTMYSAKNLKRIRLSHSPTHAHSHVHICAHTRTTTSSSTRQESCVLYSIFHIRV